MLLTSGIQRTFSMIFNPVRADVAARDIRKKKVGHTVCFCWMCHGGYELRRERRADRQRTRRELRAATDNWNYGERRRARLKN